MGIVIVPMFIHILYSFFNTKISIVDYKIISYIFTRKGPAMQSVSLPQKKNVGRREKPLLKSVYGTAPIYFEYNKC